MSIILLVRSILVLALHLDSEEDVKLIHDHIVQSRQTIHSGHLLVDIIGINNGLHYEMKCEIWFDGEKTRCDRFVKDRVRATNEKICLNKTDYIWIYDKKGNDGSEIVITFDQTNSTPMDQRPELPIDPRFFGIVPSDIQFAKRHRKSPFDCIDRMLNDKQPVLTKMLDDLSISFINNGNNYKLILDSKKAYSV